MDYQIRKQIGGELKGELKTGRSWGQENSYAMSMIVLFTQFLRARITS